MPNSQMNKNFIQFQSICKCYKGHFLSGDFVLRLLRPSRLECVIKRMTSKAWAYLPP